MTPWNHIICAICMGCALTLSNNFFSYSQNKQVKTVQTSQKKTTNKKTANKKTTQQTTKSKKNTQSEINNLKNKQNNINKNVKKIDKNLETNRKNAKQNLKQLEKLNQDIRQRNEVILSQGKNIKQLDEKIDKMSLDINIMTDEYNYMKEKYVQLIYHAYVKQNQMNRLMFVLSSHSFYEAYRRFEYLSRFASLRKKQAENIDKARFEINKKKQDVEIAKIESKKLLESHESEKKQLLAEKEKQNNVLTSLKLQEKELIAELEEQKKLSDELNKKIQDLIAKQAREAAEREKKKQATKPKSTSTYAMTKTEKVVSSGFEKHIGQLPWPVAGSVTGHFGIQPHPVLKNITTDNKGIYITAAKGAEAKVVYDGVVSHKFSIPGNNAALIVRHGNYLTVYANLTKIYVNVGQEIKSGTKIGKIFDDPDNKYRATLFFQVWKEKDLQNPEKWLKK